MLLNTVLCNCQWTNISDANFLAIVNGIGIDFVSVQMLCDCPTASERSTTIGRTGWKETRGPLCLIGFTNCGTEAQAQHEPFDSRNLVVIVVYKCTTIQDTSPAHACVVVMEQPRAIMICLNISLLDFALLSCYDQEQGDELERNHGLVFGSPMGDWLELGSFIGIPASSWHSALERSFIKIFSLIFHF
jgi:hypothetical protein